MFIDFHLVVPSSMSVAAAHQICDRLELAIKAEFPDALISIHVEPSLTTKPSTPVARYMARRRMPPSQGWKSRHREVDAARSRD